MKFFGKECEFSSKLDTTKGMLIVASNLMSAAISYSFVVTVSSLDGRVARKTVMVNPVSANGVEVSIANSKSNFNIGRKQVLIGFLTAKRAAKCTWSVEDSLGLPVPFTALTNTSRTFAERDIISQVMFPLSFRKGAFVGGGTYTFKLSTSPIDRPLLVSYSEIIMTANTPPTGGYVISSPASGKAIVTPFLISTPGWSSEAGNLPLIYKFSYRVAESSPYLFLTASSLRAYTTSALPAGLSQLDDAVTVRAKAIDIFETSAIATTTVAVKLDRSVNLTQTTAEQLKLAFASANVNLVYQTVNNVSYRTCFNGCFTLSPCSVIVGSS